MPILKSRAKRTMCPPKRPPKPAQRRLPRQRRQPKSTQSRTPSPAPTIAPARARTRATATAAPTRPSPSQRPRPRLRPPRPNRLLTRLRATRAAVDLATTSPIREPRWPARRTILPAGSPSRSLAPVVKARARPRPKRLQKLQRVPSRSRRPRPRRRSLSRAPRRAPRRTLRRSPVRNPGRAPTLMRMTISPRRSQSAMESPQCTYHNRQKIDHH